jgi:predicted Zn-dependent protease
VLAVAETDGRQIPAPLLRDLGLLWLDVAVPGRVGDDLLRQAAARGDGAARAAVDARAAAADRETVIDRMVESDPAAVEARLKRARRALDVGDFDASLIDADAVLVLRPSESRARALRLENLNELGRFDQARSEAETLHGSGLIQRRPALWIESAKAAAGQKQLDLAITELRAYVHRYPADSSGWFLLSRYAEMAGDAELTTLADKNYKRSMHNIALREHADSLRAERMHRAVR